MHNHPHGLLHAEPHAGAFFPTIEVTSPSALRIASIAHVEAGTALPLHLAAGRHNFHAVFNLLQIANMIRHMLQNYSKVSRTSCLATSWLQRWCCF